MALESGQSLHRVVVMSEDVCVKEGVWIQVSK